VAIVPTIVGEEKTEHWMNVLKNLLKFFEKQFKG